MSLPNTPHARIFLGSISKYYLNTITTSVHQIHIGFGGGRTYTTGFINLDLTVGPIRAAHLFHVIDPQTAYHLFLGRP